MAINSYGYGEADLNEAEWARMSALTGSPYGYSHAGAIEPYLAGGLVLGFGDGSTSGGGVLDDFTGHKHTLPATAAWWCVCLRRSWGSAGRKSDIVALQTAAPGVPASRKAQPGVQDDQPIAFAQTSGSTITALVDARLSASKDFYVRDIRAVFDPQLGATYTLPNGDKWGTSLTSAGTVQLVRDTTKDPTTLMRWKPPAYGYVTGVTTDAQGSAVLRHDLGFKPSFFQFSYEVSATSLPLMVEQAYPRLYTDAITDTTVRVFIRRGADGAVYANQNVSRIDWTAFGGY